MSRTGLAYVNVPLPGCADNGFERREFGSPVQQLVRARGIGNQRGRITGTPRSRNDFDRPAGSLLDFRYDLAD